MSTWVAEDGSEHRTTPDGKVEVWCPYPLAMWLGCITHLPPDRARPPTTTPNPSNKKRVGGNPFWLVGLGIGFAQDVVRGVREFRRTQ